jgi:hypothetical protein
MRRFTIGLVAFVGLAALASTGICPKGVFYSSANAEPKAREKCEWSGEVRYERNASYESEDETLKLDESLVAIVEMEKNKETAFGFETRSASGSYNLKYFYFSGDSCVYSKADLTGGGIIQMEPKGAQPYSPGKGWVLISLEIYPDSKVYMDLKVNILPPTSGVFINHHCGPPPETKQYPIPQYWDPEKRRDPSWLDFRQGVVIRITGNVRNNIFQGTKTFTHDALAADLSGSVGAYLGPQEIPAPITVKYNFSCIKKDKQ